jgi:ATP-dependent helicase/DNAse subunit B
MSLTLVLGPANSAKAGEVLGAYRAAPGALLVVPTLADVRHYERELAGPAPTAQPWVGSVATFTGLSREIAKRVGYAGRVLSSLQQQRLIRRVVARASLVELAASASAPGFARAALGVIAELERSLVTPQRFTQALRSWAEEDERRRRYGDEVASIYSSYHRELDRLGGVDPELFAWRALDELRAAPGRWEGRAVFLYGFDDLHPLERDAVEALAGMANADVTVSLTYEPGRAALAARAETVEELRPLAAFIRELPADDEHYVAASTAALHHLERGLFEPTRPRVDPGDAVQLLEAGGERAEIELVAAEVSTLLRAGIPGDEMAVVYRSLAKPAALVERVFEEFGIPLAVERQVPISHTALGRGVLALARCALMPQSRAHAEDLLAYLRSPGLLEQPEIADKLERDVRRDGLRTAEEARARLAWRLDEIDSLRAADDQLAQLARQARRLFAAPHRRAAAVLGPDEELDGRALAVIESALVDLGELDEHVRGADLIETLSELTVPAGVPPRPGAVVLADPLAIRARRFRTVFLCGLQEGEFPQLAGSEPFLSDERRRELALASGLRLRPREAALASERYLFYACSSRATERLYLSYRSSDEEGNLALASPFVADVAELMSKEWVDRRRKRLLADVVWDPSEAPTARELARAQAALSAPRASGEMEVETRSLSEQTMAKVRHRDVVSPGALECYGDCPVKWLVERELQPDRLDPQPDPIARGSLMHEALERTLTRLGSGVSEARLAEASQILEEVLTELPATVAVGRSSVVRRGALHAIAADLRRYLVHEASSGSEFAIGGLELRFGFEGEDEPAEDSLPALELASSVRVRGVIDRLDVDREGRAIVRDYKSGSTRREHQGARWSEDRRLQVALYMVAVRELLGLDPVAGLYQPLGGKELRARGVFLEDAPVGGVVDTDARDREELDAVLEDARARAVALAERLRDGELEPSPRTCSRDGCAYPGICWAG